MPTSISLLLFLTCAPYPLSSTPTTHNRRTLHQSFFPQDSIPPSQPSNTTLKLPFSTTPTTATPSPSSDQQPFPSFPSPPPPPLPPSPPSPFANISSLSLSLPTPSNPNLTPPSSSRPFSPPLSSSSSSSSSTSARKKQHSNFCPLQAKIAKWVSTEKNERIVANHHNIVINLKQTEKSAEYGS